MRLPERNAGAQTPWHSRALPELCGRLRADPEAGLTEEEARRRLASEGPNVLPEAAPPSPLKLLLRQFSSLIIWVLIGAALVSGLLQDWIDAGAILAIVILNALLGFAQEFKAEKSLAALKRYAVATARVIRGGVDRTIPARELVPGDLIQIEAGDQVPADARVVYLTGFQTQEASLTGESTPVRKSLEPLTTPEVPLGDRSNMVYMGTVVVTGKARALVVETGLRTELGRIAAMIEKAAQAEREETPLQRRLEHLGHTLLWLSLGIVGLVFVLGTLRGEPLVPMFLTAVSLAVAAIPEGLPAVVTITLALGVTRMVKRHALIRRLPAVETLGSTTVICSDKTGTLTKNEMTVTRIYQDGRMLEVTGEGYAPLGEIRSVDGPVSGGTDPGLMELLRALVLCNGADLQREESSWKILGDPTEGALLVAAAKAGLWKHELEHAATFLGEVPFDPERKKMTIVRRTPSGPVAFVKGAPDVLVGDCVGWLTGDGSPAALSDDARKEVLSANQELASQGLRVLGVAMRPLDAVPATYEAGTLERGLTLLGLVGMRDPVRPEAKVAVETCRAAGIRTVMITGDHQGTAVAIARELGVMEPGLQPISGTDLDRVPDDELAQRVSRFAVYARVSAEHKLKIVRAWKRQGAVVAMTGDGVNDAPAVKEADIGVAMGITGTAVTKEAADMVVTDDNFASIAAAVEEGRAIFDNIRKAIHYLLSCNISEILVMFLAALIGLPLPLLPAQILWINLVTDGLPALALAADPAAPDLMRRPPRDPRGRILEPSRLAVMLAQGLFMALLAFGAFGFTLYRMPDRLETARAVTFTVLVLVQLAHALNCRSQRLSLFRLGWGTNPKLLWAVGGSLLLQILVTLYPGTQEVFRVGGLTATDWGLAIGLGLLPLAAMEGWKWVASRRAVSPRDPG